MARLTAAGRKALPASKFALGKGHYPIDTANRARNALARGSQFASPSEQATIKRKVHAAYPGIKQAGARGPAPVEGTWQAGARGHADEAQDRKLIIHLIKAHTNAPVAGARSKSNWGGRDDGNDRTRQSGARMAGPMIHPRMHSLSKASANHLLNMGHIDTKLHGKIHKASAKGMASMMPPPAFGSMAPPDAMASPIPAPMIPPGGGAQMAAPPPMAGARRYKQPKYGAGHYMSTPTPTGADEGGGMGGGGSAGARRKKW